MTEKHYLEELRENWRPLLAATVGMGSGMSVVGVITSTIAPSLIADTGWSKADFAMVGSLALVTSFAFPFIGRLADLIGVKLTALIGQVTVPLVYLAFSLMSGDFGVYLVIFAIQSFICVTTTATVYTRLAVQYVRKARGLALAIVASGPAVTGIILAPILNSYVETNGWRESYQAMAMFAAVAGLITFLLIPSERRSKDQLKAAPKRKAREDYPVIFRTPAFWILLVAMLFCNLPATILLVQLKLLMLDNGVTGEGAAVMLSTLSVGMLAGRFITGVALDRFKPQLVSFITLGLPSLGLFVIASSYDAPAILTAAVFFLGFAFGAEGDIVAFLVARYFAVEIYSSVLGLLTASMSFSTASGAALLSITLAQTGGFELFLVIVGTAVLVGAASLLLLGETREPPKLAKLAE
jgi:MFS family permease